MNASWAALVWSVLYSCWRFSVSRVFSAACAASTTAGLSYMVKNDLAPDFGSTAKVASSSGSLMSIVHSVSVMSYFRLWVWLFSVFGSSWLIFTLMPSGLSLDWTIVEIVREAELSDGHTIEV